MSKSNEFERVVALAWFMCHYNEKQAKLSAELQSLDWNNIQHEYGNLYAQQEALSNG